MEKSVELTRIALLNMITGFVMFLGLGLLGYAMRLDQAGFWTFDPSVFYEIMTLHGAGMVAAALIAAIGGLVEVLNGSTPLDTRLLWTAYVVGSLAFAIVVIAIVVGGVGAGWTMLYPLPYQSQGEWTITAAFAVFVGYFLTAVAFLLYCIVFLQGTTRAAGSLGKALALKYLFPEVVRARINSQIRRSSWPRSSASTGLPPSSLASCGSSRAFCKPTG